MTVPPFSCLVVQISCLVLQSLKGVPVIPELGHVFGLDASAERWPAGAGPAGQHGERDGDRHHPAV